MLDLHLLAGEYAICRLPVGSPLPSGLGALRSGIVSITWTPEETSVLCPSDKVPDGAVTETLWRCFRAGPVNLAQTGVMASLSGPLAEARINIFAFSTHDSDYLLVPAVRLSESMTVLTGAGHRVTSAVPSEVPA